MKFLISRHYKADGGSIYVKKMAQSQSAQIITLESIGNLFKFYLLFLDSKLGKFISRLPYYEAIFGKIIFEIIFLMTPKKNFHVLLKHELIVVSERLILLQLVYKIRKNNFHFMCLDLPWSYKNSKLNKSFIQKTSKRILNKCVSVNVCSKKMLSELQTSNSVMSFITFSSFDYYLSYLDLNFQDRVIKYEKKNLKLVYVGTFRFLEELNSTLDFLDANGVKYTLDIFSKSKLMRKNVNNKGFVNGAKLQKSLKFYDFGLVPMSKNAEEKLTVTTSFPSKSHFYLKSGIPILASAPKNSTIYDFIKYNKVGVSTEDLLNKSFFEFEVSQFAENMYNEWQRYFNFFEKKN